jgi:hypothetical protein
LHCIKEKTAEAQKGRINQRREGHRLKTPLTPFSFLSLSFFFFFFFSLSPSNTHPPNSLTIDEVEERLVNEEYKIWKKNTPFLYGEGITLN